MVAVIGAAGVGMSTLSAGSASADERQSASTVYTESNAPTGNVILAYRLTPSGLVAAGSTPTGGNGSGAGLGSQGAVVVSGDRVLAVNAGSNSVSLLEREDNGSLRLMDVAGSGGVRPVSVTVRGRTVYVVNAGDHVVTGFRISDDRLKPIVGSTHTLPGDGDSQISFDRTGTRLVVTERATNTIQVLPVTNGVAGDPVSNPSVGATPFGFSIDARNHVIVSNAAGGAAGASSVTSYAFDGATGLSTITGPVADNQSAACWVALTPNGRYAFVTNTASGTVSSYAVAQNGAVTLSASVAAATGAGPIDLVVTNREIVTLNGAAHTLTVSRIGANGALAAAGSITVPTGVAGLAG